VAIRERGDGEVDKRPVGIRFGGDDDGVLSKEQLVQRFGPRAGKDEHRRRRGRDHGAMRERCGLLGRLGE
jgi:hypothetical protein